MAPPCDMVILFDLDNTLFDHYHSLRCAISAVQKKYPGLAETQVSKLVDLYNECLQQAYDRYLEKVITYDETESEKVKLFFQALRLPEPTAQDIKGFRETYKPVYRQNRRATPGSIETLARLRENGYRVGIITNGQTRDQTDKAKAIGIYHLIDCVITSEEADIRIFQHAKAKLSSGSRYVVGDSINSDIRGALDAQHAAILYSPLSQDNFQHLSGQPVPVIIHMSYLLGHLDISNPSFDPQFTSTESDLVVHGLGIDIVTEPRHCLNAPQDVVLQLAEGMGLSLVALSMRHYITAMSFLEQMIKAIAKVSAPIREECLLISYPGQGKEATKLPVPEMCIVKRRHSIYVAYDKLGLHETAAAQVVIQEVTLLLQSHCNYLMKDYPRAAIRELRAAMLKIATMGGLEKKVVITGEEIDK
ncbi:hypothetical protein IL306_009431 [Fusarium sp. DS 682]|nr:hypothetical protein IL306_009431 [Fusarium sp. DS 682]